MLVCRPIRSSLGKVCVSAQAVLAHTDGPWLQTSLSLGEPVPVASCSSAWGGCHLCWQSLCWCAEPFPAHTASPSPQVPYHFALPVPDALGNLCLYAALSLCANLYEIRSPLQSPSLPAESVFSSRALARLHDLPRSPQSLLSCRSSVCLHHLFLTPCLFAELVAMFQAHGDRAQPCFGSTSTGDKPSRCWQSLSVLRLRCLSRFPAFACL